MRITAIMERWCYLALLLYMSQTIQAPQVGAQTDSATLSEIKKLLTAPGLLKVSPTINIECVIEHCIKQSAGCLLDANCRRAISCAQKCMDKWDEDKTPEKFHVQNSTTAALHTRILHTNILWVVYPGISASHSHQSTTLAAPCIRSNNYHSKMYQGIGGC